MKKIIAGIVLLVGVLVVFSMINSGQSNEGEQGSVSEAPSASASASAQEFLEGANIADTLDATDESEVTISIDDFVFQTTEITVTPGTTITWVNEGTAAHDVVSVASSPSSGLGSDLLRNGDTYSYTFDEVGEYFYECSPHPRQMRGVVKVVAES